MKRNITPVKPKHGEKGIALLFTLSILSIILVVVMIFCANSLIESKVARAYVNAGSAKLIAQSALAYALSDLSGNIAVQSSAYMYSHGEEVILWNENAAKTTYDEIWKLETPGILTVLDSSGVSNSAVGPHWKYILGADNRFIGRYAYVMLLDDARLNPNAIASHHYCVNSGIAGNGTCPKSNSSACTNHFGYSVAELTFDNSTSANGTPSLPFSSVQLTGAKENGSFYPWDDTDLMLRDIGRTFTDKEKEIINRHLNVTNMDYDRELYYAAPPPDNTSLGIYKERANLRGINWATETVDSIKTKIPYFKHLPDEAAANLISYNLPANHSFIADADNVPTATKWDNVTPSYVGLKSAPLFNDAGIEVQFTGYKHAVTDSKTNKTTYTVSYKMEINMYTELIRMFQGLNGPYKPKLSGKISFQYNKSSNGSGFWGWLGFPSTVQKSVTIYLKDLVVPSAENGTDSGYLVYTDYNGNNTAKFSQTFDGGSFDARAFAEWADAAKIEDFQIEIQNVGIFSGEKLVSFAKINQSSGAVKHVFPDGESIWTKRFRVYADDPRVLCGGWRTQKDDDVVFANAVGRVNEGLTLNKDHSKDDTADYEKDVVNPAVKPDGSSLGISTAYIRHATMETLWELGAIHRGKPWQTIRLSKLPDTLPTDDGSDQIAYSAGDGYLLDQVSFIKDEPGMINSKVNLYSKTPDIANFAMSCLLSGMKLSPNALYSETNGGANGTPENASLLTYSISGDSKPTLSQGNTSVTLSKSRAELIKVLADNIAEQTTDAAKEQRVARLAPLTKVDTDFETATVIILAQSLQEVDATVPYLAIKNDVIYSGTRYDNTSFIASQKPAASDNDTNLISSSPGGWDRGIDKITGEVKMIVYLRNEKLYTPVNSSDLSKGYKLTRKWKVKRVQYVD